MAPNWRRFLLVHLPLALAALALAAEGLSAALERVPPQRHDLDRLALATAAGGMNADVAVIGDSVTQDILKSYRVAAPGRVANLTTNKANGVVGAMFLLRRYLRNNPPIRHLVIASTPEFFGYDPEGKAAEIYLTSVFRDADETDWLARNMPGVMSKAWEPAVLNIEGRIGYPLLALAAPRVRGLPEGAASPDPDLEVETTPTSEWALEDIRNRSAHDLGLTPVVETALGEICALGRKEGFQIHILRAPVPATVFEAWRARGTLAAFEAKLDAVLAESCRNVVARRVDFGADERFPDLAMRDADHLRRPGWANRYALMLADFIRTLP